MELKSNVCPNCGAKVKLQRNEEMPSCCVYCGSQLLQVDENELRNGKHIS